MTEVDNRERGSALFWTGQIFLGVLFVAIMVLWYLATDQPPMCYDTWKGYVPITQACDEGLCGFSRAKWMENCLNQ